MFTRRRFTVLAASGRRRIPGPTRSSGISMKLRRCSTIRRPLCSLAGGAPQVLAAFLRIDSASSVAGSKAVGTRDGWPKSGSGHPRGLMNPFHARVPHR